ncbi:MAG: energy-coupling factor ABC transporter ATP-binding protein [Vulcanimicrobiota bacterium]
MTDTVYRVKDLEFSYPGSSPVLQNISFTINSGEKIAIMGANACGKSTLLHLLNGLYFADRGEIKAYGTLLTEDAVESPPFMHLFRSRVGFLFQNSDAQLFCPTVEEELEFGPLQLQLSMDDVKRRVDDALHLFEIAHLRSRAPHTLSGGEKKRVALASIMTCSPAVILLDEPGAGLDPRTLRWFRHFFKSLNSAGATLILSSHDLRFVEETTDRALIISEEHSLVYDGPTCDALKDNELLASVNLI